MTQQLNSHDRAVLDLIRARGPLSVSEFVQQLGVTATAVRQRLNRLLACGMVNRVVTRQGRGRPHHEYSLTEKAHEAIGDNFADFAKALWTEVQKIPQAEVRQAVIEGVVQRLSSLYVERIHGETIEERLQSIAQFFAERQIPFVFEQEGQAPSLKIMGCPYPELSAQNSEICELEQKVLSRLSTIPLSVDRCHCESGGVCCSFQPDAKLFPAESINHQISAVAVTSSSQIETESAQVPVEFQQRGDSIVETQNPTTQAN